MYDGRPLIVTEAEEPVDIIWENMGVKYKKKFAVKALSLFVLTIVWFICFWAIYQVKYYQVSQKLSQNEHYILQLLLGFAITLTNFILAFIIKFVSKYGYEKSHTQ